jgi:predicted O-methyltransferase YrrM
VPDHYEQLFAAVEACRPRRILEIGTWDGAHGAEMIRVAQRFHKDIEYWGFDLWEPAPDEELSKPAVSMEDARKRLEETGAKITLVKGNTRKTLRSLAEEMDQPGDFDFAFIDGGHSHKTIKSDWIACSWLCLGTIVFDDYYPDRDDVGAKKLVDSLIGSMYEVSLGPVTEYPNMRVRMATVRMVQ